MSGCFFLCRSGSRHETYVSAQQNQAKTPAWVPGPHADQGRTSGYPRPPGQGASAFECIKTTLARIWGFSRDSRLLSTRDFQRVFRSNQRSVDGFFLVLATPNGLDHARLGLALSKRQLPRAVSRNRFKRLIRESFRLHKDDLAGLDIVVVARRDTATCSNEKARHSLAAHWQRLVDSRPGKIK